MTTRLAYREAVAQTAAKAHAKLPACASRIDAAVKLVLLGEVTLLPDGTAQVGSCTDPTKNYSVNGTCTCKDYERAPGNLCKHRLAYGVARRAAELLPALPPPEEGERGSQDMSTPVPPASDATVAATVAPVTLPEAPCSINVRLIIAGRDVQLTLRGTDEAEVLTRLEAVLTRYPQPQAPAAPPSTGHGQDKDWCRKHNVPMKQTTKDGRSWWSHWTADGWCKGR